MIRSPCIKICEVDPKSRLCRGCGRSLDEIGRWSLFSDGQRAEIMAALPARLARAGLDRAESDG